MSCPRCKSEFRRVEGKSLICPRCGHIDTPSLRTPKVRCLLCNKTFNGEDAGRHRKETGHNNWELIP